MPKLQAIRKFAGKLFTRVSDLSEQVLADDDFSTEVIDVANSIQTAFSALSDFAVNASVPTLPQSPADWGRFFVDSGNFMRRAWVGLRPSFKIIDKVMILVGDKRNEKTGLSDLRAAATTDAEVSAVADAEKQFELLDILIDDADESVLNEIESSGLTSSVIDGINARDFQRKIGKALDVLGSLTAESKIAASGEVIVPSTIPWSVDTGYYGMATGFVGDQPISVASAATSTKLASDWVGTMDQVRDLATAYVVPSGIAHPFVVLSQPNIVTFAEFFKPNCYDWELEVTLACSIVDAGVQSTIYGSNFTVTLATAAEDAGVAPSDWHKVGQYNISNVGVLAGDPTDFSLTFRQDYVPGQSCYWDLDIAAMLQPTSSVLTVHVRDIAFIGKPRRTITCPISEIKYWNNNGGTYSLQSITSGTRWIDLFGKVARVEADDPNFNIVTLWATRIQEDRMELYEICSAMKAYSTKIWGTAGPSIDDKYAPTGTGLVGMSNLLSYLFDDGQFNGMDTSEIQTMLSYFYQDVEFVVDSFGLDSDMTKNIVLDNASVMVV
jgi:hypothetical protein